MVGSVTHVSRTLKTPLDISWISSQVRTLGPSYLLGSPTGGRAYSGLVILLLPTRGSKR
jgi:hypothetical protein